ncbi:MAG: hypothetical protein HPM95_21130 [Alphaproteobacteria bacterium]|nr:hypothetical protein [Alphaproteobacteria bacterium]
MHTAFGFARRTNRIAVDNGVTSQTVLLNAGGMSSTPSSAATCRSPPAGSVSTSTSAEFDSRGERKLVAGNIAPGESCASTPTPITWSAATAVNAVVRADIHVEPGKLTEATVYHNAARVTLKLVNQRGGEALASTAWAMLRRAATWWRKATAPSGLHPRIEVNTR